jgi:hypothetical protein
MRLAVVLFGSRFDSFESAQTPTSSASIWRCRVALRRTYFCRQKKIQCPSASAAIFAKGVRRRVPLICSPPPPTFQSPCRIPEPLAIFIRLCISDIILNPRRLRNGELDSSNSDCRSAKAAQRQRKGSAKVAQRQRKGSAKAALRQRIDSPRSIRLPLHYSPLLSRGQDSYSVPPTRLLPSTSSVLFYIFLL